MSNIDLGDNPQGAPPTEDQKTQIKNVLGLNPPMIGWGLDFNPASPALFLTNGYANYNYLPDTYIGDAGAYEDSASYTSSGEQNFGMGDHELYREADGTVYLRIYGFEFTAYAEDPIPTYDGYLNLAFTPSGDVTDIAPEISYLPIAVQPQAIGQVLWWQFAGRYLIATSLTEYYDGSYWLPILNRNGDYGTPSSIDLTFAQNVPLSQANGVLPVTNGGTGSAFASGSTGAVTNLTTVSSNSATTITLSNAMSGTILRITAATAVTIYVPTGLADKFNVSIIQEGAGQVTFTPNSGVTLQSKGNFRKISNQHGRVDIIRLATSQYNLSGDLMA